MEIVGEYSDEGPSEFKDAIQDRIGATVDTSDLEKQLSVLNANLHQAETIKTRLEIGLPQSHWL